MCAPSRWAFRFSTASIPILISLHEVYDKICSYAENLVKTGEDISREYGIPIVNKRIAVTPIAMLAGANPGASPVRFAKALDRAAKTVGVNFIGGYSALVHKALPPAITL